MLPSLGTFNKIALYAKACKLLKSPSLSNFLLNTSGMKDVLGKQTGRERDDLQTAEECGLFAEAPTNP